MLVFFANYPASLIGIEACGGAHHWGRELTKLGHQVVLLNARYVKNFVVGNKNDFNDAQAIFDAVTRSNKRVAAIKTLEQQDVQLVHNIRQDLVDKRTALVNQLRGLLSERGIVIAQGIDQVRKELPLILEEAENGLTSLSREVLAEQYKQLRALDQAIKDHHGKGYASSRDYAASLGVVPRQHSSGDKAVYLGISKRGNRYIRTKLIHGARSLVKYCSGKTDPLNRWLQALVERRGFNKAAVALANKNARILWAMATEEQAYEPKVA